MTTTRTPVSKSSKAIKAVVAACFPTWTGRKVTVIEAGPEWAHVHYLGDQTQATRVYLDSGIANALPGPTIGGPSVVYRAEDGRAVVLLSRFMGSDMGVEIVVPVGAIDPAAVMVATDALLEGNGRLAVATLEQCGVYAGIAMALVEARARGLKRGEGGASKRPAKGSPTGLNVWLLGTLAAGLRSFPNRVTPPQRAGLRRCLKAGLVEVVDRQTLRLTAEGVDALNADPTVPRIAV